VLKYVGHGIKKCTFIIGREGKDAHRVELQPFWLIFNKEVKRCVSCPKPM